VSAADTPLTVEEEEVDAPHLRLERLAQVADAQLDRVLHPRLGPVRARLRRLGLLVLRANHPRLPTERGGILRRREREVDRAHAVARAGLDDRRGPARARERVHELALVLLEGDELVGHGGVEALRGDGEEVELRLLGQGEGVQPLQEGVDVRGGAHGVRVVRVVGGGGRDCLGRHGGWWWGKGWDARD
jgi:hypothetical protein